jgi:hypothetical protein
MVTQDESRKLLIGEDPEQEAVPQRLVGCNASSADDIDCLEPGGRGTYPG